MAEDAAHHHRKAAEYHEQAARHHRHAADYQERGDDQLAGHHAHVAQIHHYEAPTHAGKAAERHVPMREPALVEE